MSEKKNDDFVVQIPEKNNAFEDQRPLMGNGASSGASMANPLSSIDNSPVLSVLSYCLASMSMTVVNKYVVSGSSWNLNFFYLAVQVIPSIASQNQPSKPRTKFCFQQSIVCIAAIFICRQAGMIRFAPFDMQKGKRCLSRLALDWILDM